MMTRADVVTACLRFSDAYEDYPFDDPNWTALRHKTNQKIFALVFERDGRIWINLKAEPMRAEFWRAAYPAVLPGYHMNKRHWISVILDGSMDDNEILPLIEDSYELTFDRRSRRSVAKN